MEDVGGGAKRGVVVEDVVDEVVVLPQHLVRGGGRGRVRIRVKDRGRGQG